MADQQAASSSTGASDVTLHVYSLGTTSTVKRANRLLHMLGTGIFHAGVEVYGVEYFFAGHATETGSGIRKCIPGACDNHTHFKSLPMGRVERSKDDVLAILREMSGCWTMELYNLLTRNCCHFALEFMSLLGVDLRLAPRWLLRSSNLAAKLSHAGVWRTPACVQDPSEEQKTLMPCATRPHTSTLASLKYGVISALKQSRMALCQDADEAEKSRNTFSSRISSRFCSSSALSCASACRGMSVRVAVPVPRRRSIAGESEAQPCV
jgi:hypothetical protein